MHHFNYLTDRNLRILDAGRPPGHIVNYFRLQESFAVRSNFRGFSIRYVSEGAEHYLVNGQEYRVRAGEYLLTNPHCRSTESMSPAAVTGLCIDLMPETVTQVFAALRQPDEPCPEPSLDNWLATGDLFEHLYRADETPMGTILQVFFREIAHQTQEQQTIDPSFFPALAEGYIRDCLDLQRQLQSVPAAKKTTRRELLRRLARGRGYIDDCFSEDFLVSDIARAANISEYHFFRLFRRVYGITPHRYLLQKRLQHGQALLLSGRYSVSEVALSAGFADVYSFSKAYKKQFGQAPSKLRG